MTRVFVCVYVCRINLCFHSAYFKITLEKGDPQEKLLIKGLYLYPFDLQEFKPGILFWQFHTWRRKIYGWHVF